MIERETTTLPWQGTVCALVPLDAGHAPILHRMVNGTVTGTGWRTRGRLVSFDTFLALVEGEAQVSILSPDGGTLLGFCGLTNVDEFSGFGSLSMFVDQDHVQAVEIATQACSAYLDYVFGTWGLRRVLVETCSDVGLSIEQFASRSAFVDEVGRVPDHVLLGGRFRDLRSFVVHGEGFLARATRRSPARPRRPPIEFDGDPFELVTGEIARLLDTAMPVDLSGATLLTHDLGFDSMLLFELFSAIDENFGIAVTGWSSEDLSVQNLAELVAAAARAHEEDRHWTS